MKPANPVAAAPAVHFLDVEIPARVLLQQAGNKTFVIDADLLIRNREAGTVQVLGQGYHKGALVRIAGFYPENGHAQIFHGPLDPGHKAVQVFGLGQKIAAEFLPGLFPGLEKDPVRSLHAEIPDKNIPERELHEAVHGQVHHGAEIRSAGFNVAQHAPGKLNFIPVFFKHTTCPPILFCD